MKKQIIQALFIVVIIIIVTVSLTFYTYSLFESDAVSPATSDLAKWNIKVNNSMITGLPSGQNQMNIGNITWNSGGHVRAGKAAPGSVGYFEIEIDPTDTQVSFIYELELDMSNIDNEEFEIQSVIETNNNTIVRTGEYTYAGIMSLSAITNEEIHNIRVNIIWNNNEQNNESDYELGIRAEMEVYIPVTIRLTQYHGTEVLTPYQEEGD